MFCFHGSNRQLPNWSRSNCFELFEAVNELPTGHCFLADENSKASHVTLVKLFAANTNSNSIRFRVRSIAGDDSQSTINVSAPSSSSETAEPKVLPSPLAVLSLCELTEGSSV